MKHLDSSPQHLEICSLRPLNSSLLLQFVQSVQGQVGRGFEQPGLVEGVPAHGRGLELDDL